jgi:hypothetical protein
VPRASLADYEIRPLTSADLAGVAAFSCGDADLDDFVRTDALQLQGERMVATYVARASRAGNVAVVGYVSVLVDAIVLQGPERKKMKVKTGHPIVPALKIARLGVTSDRQRSVGIGTTLVAFAHYVGVSLGESVGCRLLTVDAYPQSVAFYERLGFVPNKAKEYRDRGHPSMRLDLYAAVRPAWL